MIHRLSTRMVRSTTSTGATSSHTITNWRLRGFDKPRSSRPHFDEAKARATNVLSMQQLMILQKKSQMKSGSIRKKIQATLIVLTSRTIVILDHLRKLHPVSVSSLG